MRWLSSLLRSSWCRFPSKGRALGPGRSFLFSLETKQKQSCSSSRLKMTTIREPEVDDSNRFSIMLPQVVLSQLLSSQGIHWSSVLCKEDSTEDSWGQLHLLCIAYPIQAVAPLTLQCHKNYCVNKSKSNHLRWYCNDPFIFKSICKQILLQR